MSDQPLLPPPVAPLLSPSRHVRVEYLDFQNVAEHRHFRLRAYGPDESVEFRFRIAFTAFGPGRVRLQDGPDVCYQKVLRAVAAGEAPSPDVITIDDEELAAYLVAHTPVAKHRTWTPTPRPDPPAAPSRPARTPTARLPVAPPVSPGPEPGFEEGQRVSHAVYGVGVTASSSGGRTVVRFDQDGPKTFVTSMLQMDLLSAPHTWETTARGKNRPLPVDPPRS